MCLALYALVQYATPDWPTRWLLPHGHGRLIREQGLKPAFVWLPLTILTRQLYDHHLLFTPTCPYLRQLQPGGFDPRAPQHQQRIGLGAGHGRLDALPMRVPWSPQWALALLPCAVSTK